MSRFAQGIGKRAPIEQEILGRRLGDVIFTRREERPISLGSFAALDQIVQLLVHLLIDEIILARVGLLDGHRGMPHVAGPDVQGL